jgi:glyoxylase-like metal-dependent hydrolase (beta-lactamase superfamily II)/ferredoxin
MVADANRSRAAVGAVGAAGVGVLSQRMARLADRLPDNAPGAFYVDASCIDCDLCRQIAPMTFGHSTDREQSVVIGQPVDDNQTRRAAMALVACPTSSIGGANAAAVREAARAFPEKLATLSIGGAAAEVDVWFCGYASEDSYGASSYLLRRAGNSVLVDSPRAAKPLLARLGELGGVATMFLTHADDVADHEVLHRELDCQRIIHRADARAATSAVETKLEGVEPIRLDADLLAIPVPGHTRGSTALLYRDEVLFTGDHLWWSDERQALHASRGVCWYSWAEQTRSMERLLDHRFEWVLPGHGRRWRAPSAAAMREELERLVRRMRAVA